MSNKNTTKNTTKKALFASIVSLLLCFTMLIGTTFAWFTDTVTSAGNIIKSGTLDIEMQWADGKENPETTEEWTDASTGAIFNYDLWEPGYTEVRHVRIANVGSLALKYQLVIAPTGVPSELADVIDVYFFDPATPIENRASISDTALVGTLSDVISGATIADGYLWPQGNEDGYQVDCSVTIALKMQESAGNEYQNLSIGSDFAVQLVATQLTYEEDSFGPDYDANASYPTAEFTEGTHTLNETLVASGNERFAVLVSGEGTEVDIIGGYYQGPWALHANEKATVNIIDGTFKSNGSCAVIANGGATVNIYGGFFEAEGEFDGRSFVLNLQDNTGSDINVYGGTFVNFNPAKAETEPGWNTTPHNFLAPDYKVVEEKHGDDTWYIVRPETEVANEEQLKDALEDGTPVTLTADIELNDQIQVDNDVIIYGNGQTITSDSTTKDDAVIRVNGAASPIINISGVTIAKEGAPSGRAISVHNCTGDVVINITDKSDRSHVVL